MSKEWRTAAARLCKFSITLSLDRCLKGKEKRSAEIDQVPVVNICQQDIVPIGDHWLWNTAIRGIARARRWGLLSFIDRFLTAWLGRFLRSQHHEAHMGGACLPRGGDKAIHILDCLEAQTLSKNLSLRDPWFGCFKIRPWGVYHIRAGQETMGAYDGAQGFAGQSGLPSPVVEENSPAHSNF